MKQQLKAFAELQKQPPSSNQIALYEQMQEFIRAACRLPAERLLAEMERLEDRIEDIYLAVGLTESDDDTRLLDRIADLRAQARHSTHEACEGCGAIPAEAICTFQDRNQMCAVRGDFKNIHESPIGFGIDSNYAIADLLHQEDRKRFIEFLDDASAVVQSWPEWQRGVLEASSKSTRETPR